MSRNSAPLMMEPLLRGAEKYAIGINNKTGMPSRARLMQLFRLYVENENSSLLDERAFSRLVTKEFRNIPPSAHKELFDYLSKNSYAIPLTHLVNTLLPDRFGKERSVLDFPYTFENPKTAKEDVNIAAEQVRVEMIEYLTIRGMKHRDYFERIDQDKDSTIDVRELVANLRHNNLGIGRYHACRTLIKRFDSGGQGRLTFPDFQRLMKLKAPQSQQRLSKIAQSMLRRMGTIGRKPKEGGSQQAGSRQGGSRLNNPLGRKSNIRLPRKRDLGVPYMTNSVMQKQPWVR